MASQAVNALLRRSRVRPAGRGGMRLLPMGETDVGPEPGIAASVTAPGVIGNVEGRVSAAMLGGSIMLLMLFYFVTRGKQQ